ncbi:MAG: T9SS C-terminal target domain-containing protein [Bacteroidetes bacterium]|nr:MAG: T9SS C-terminal target domain-containing protein [Bacteroidota bacterium]
MKKSLFLSSLGIFAIAGAVFLTSQKTNIKRVYVPRANSQDVSLTKTQRWEKAREYYAALRKNIQTGKVEAKDILNAQKKVQQAISTKAASLGLNWQVIGPTNQGGRTRAIVIDPDNPLKIYAGAVSGGVFVSEDAGGSWTPLNDHAPNAAVSCLELGPDGTLWVGTGSSFDGPSGIGGSGFIGSGLYKVAPGSSTYTLVAGPSSSNQTGLEWTEINSIKVNPANSNEIYVATNKGLRKSTDGGVTWENPIVLFTSPTVIYETGEAQDIAFKDDGTIFVSISGKIYRSSNGTDFEDLVAANSILPGGASRIEIEVAKSNQDYVYVLMSDWYNSVTLNQGTFSGYGIKGMYRSKDGGDTWEKLLGEPSEIGNLFQPCGGWDGNSGQCYYDLALGVSPFDENFVIIGGVELWKWDGNISRIAYEFSSPPYYVHSDKHVITFHPTDPNIFYIGSDGGISQTWDGGNTFLDRNVGYTTTQPYDIAFDVSGWVMEGNQDNGTIVVDPATGLGQPVTGGDGFDCEFSQITDVWFSTVYNQQLYRGIDGVAGGTICGDYCNAGSFYTRIRLWESPDDPTSQTYVEFDNSPTEISVGNGNGTQKTFDGDLTPKYAGAVIVPGTITITAGSMQVTDDGNGNLTGDGGGTVDYTNQTFSVTFNSPVPNLTPVMVRFSTSFPAGTTLTLNSNAHNQTFEHTLTADVQPNDTIYIQDPFQSLIAMGEGSSNVIIAREALNIEKEPVWIQITGLGGQVNCMDYSKDGNHLFVGTWSGRVVRISGLNELYHDSDLVHVSVTTIFTSSQVVTGVAVDPNDPENLVVTLGNYGATDYVYRCTNAVSATSTGTANFESIQGDLPEMPVYDAVIDVTDKDRVVIATEFGVWATDKAFSSPGGSMSWSNESNNFPYAPVFEIEQNINWGNANTHTLYAGVHGRGIWKSTTLQTSTEDFNEQVTEGFVASLTTFPNPVKNNLTLAVEMNTTANAQLQIYDINGRVVKEVSNMRLNNGNNTFDVNVEDLQKGTYFLRLNIKNGETKINKIVKL